MPHWDDLEPEDLLPPEDTEEAPETVKPQEDAAADPQEMDE